jgi:calcineurin-like phosphoesterase family protein
MSTFFTSDQHFYHHNIINYSNRPFQNVGEMNDEIINRYNSIVGVDDVVYHLGDFAFNHKVIPGLLGRMNGKKHLISGNHDRTHPIRSKHKKFIVDYMAYGFSSVQEKLELKIGDRMFLLQHLPFFKENGDQRFPDWRPKDNGQWLLCGHVHEKWLFSDRMINVGVDQWNFYPVSESKILDLVAEIIEGEQL